MLESDPDKSSDDLQAEEDIASLSAFLRSRMEQVRRGELSTKTFEEIRESAERLKKDFR